MSKFGHRLSEGRVLLWVAEFVARLLAYLVFTFSLSYIHRVAPRMTNPDVFDWLTISFSFEVFFSQYLLKDEVKKIAWVSSYGTPTYPSRISKMEVKSLRIQCESKKI